MVSKWWAGQAPERGYTRERPTCLCRASSPSSSSSFLSSIHFRCSYCSRCWSISLFLSLCKHGSIEKSSRGRLQWDLRAAPHSDCLQREPEMGSRVSQGNSPSAQDTSQSQVTPRAGRSPPEREKAVSTHTKTKMTQTLRFSNKGF